MANICVFCSCSNAIHEDYKKAAKELGKLIGERGHTLVYGGSQLGLMGILAKAVQESGGKAIGIIPEHLHHLSNGENEVIKVKNMHHRKETFELKSDAFIALTGGIGTTDEIFDILVAYQLKIHNKPISIINTKNYYKHLIKHLNNINKQDFGTIAFDVRKVNEIFHIAKTPKEAIEFIEKKL